MYIQPNSTIDILRGVPLNPNYKDTIMFDSVGQQHAYFQGKIAYSFTEQYYQRANKNTCRVKVNAEQVYDCNYLHFRNSAFGNKDFYAFITNIEYINHNVTEVTYQIDVLQTWLFEFKNNLGKCYVEREHARSDQIGEHLLPEPVTINEYVIDGQTQAGVNEVAIYLTYSDNIDGHNAILTDGTFCSAIRMFDATMAGASQCDNAIKDIIERVGGSDALISLFLGPKYFYPMPYNDLPRSKVVVLNRPRTIAGFEPNNKKLLTSPFIYLNVDCLNDNKNYYYEYFGDMEPVFTLWGSCVGNPSVVAVPSDYKINQYDNYSEQIIMGGYPMCCIPIDSAKQWLANNGVYQVLTGLGGAVSAGAGAFTGNPLLAVAGVATMVNSVAKSAMEISRENTSRGTVTTAVNVQNKSKDFYFRTMTVNYEKAKSIDDFFSRYGYTCERVKVPNTKVRKRWTYTKTNGCIVNGNLPADDKQTIAQIFDNGITFWTTAGNVGDYVMEDNGII